MSAKVEKTKEEIEAEENDLSNPAIITKYQTAGDIANKSLLAVLALVKPGATVKDLCAAGDESIKNLTAPIYNKGKVKKGIAFPTTVSPRNFVCNLSPLDSDPEASLTIQEGDVVRVELGVHIDGYIAQAAKTVVVGDKPVTGKKADVIAAAHTCLEAALRIVKAGGSSEEFTSTVGKIAKEYGVVPVEGMLSQQLLRNVIDGPNQMHQNPPEDVRTSGGVSKFTFEKGQVYSICLLLTTSAEGKTKSAESTRTTIYKRNEGAVYQLKMKSSRAVFSEVQKDFGTMAFQLNSLSDEKTARMGIIECVSHGLLTPYQVLQEKEEDAQLATAVVTVLLQSNGPIILSQSISTLDERVKSDKKVTDQEILDLLALPVRKKK